MLDEAGRHRTGSFVSTFYMTRQSTMSAAAQSYTNVSSVDRGTVKIMLFWFAVQLAKPMHCNESNNNDKKNFVLFFFCLVGIFWFVTRCTGHAAMPEEPKHDDNEK